MAYSHLYTKTINDPIHGHLELDELTVAVVDTPQFQRLRDLKQLGAAYFVYPGASHCRFEHSIGVSHLAGDLVLQIQGRQPELDITTDDVKAVRLAGLCHDLGHGPFSHVFDGEFIKKAKPGIQWSHEDASQMLLEDLVNDNNIPDISTDEVKLIKDLIAGEETDGGGGTGRRILGREGKRFLFDIVANKRNSIDVDKFDYLSRDCYNVGMKSNYDSQRLMKMSRVINDEICFNKNEHYNIYQMFHTRYTLFKSVYTHKTGKAVEFMIVDALLAADPVLHMSDSIYNPKEYATLSDGIIREIERSRDPLLEESRVIIKRLRKRDLYRYVDRVILNQAQRSIWGKDDFSAESIVACLPTGSPTIRAEDIVVEWLELNYGKKDQNPVDMVKFYSKYDPHNAFHIPGHQESLLVPREFNELNIRLFSKKSEHIALIQEAFRARLRQLNREKWDQLRSMGGSDHLGIGGGSINNINNDENGGGINKVLMSVKEYRTSGAAFGARDGEAVDMMMGFEEDDDDDSSHHPSFLLSSSSCAASRSSRMGGGGGGGDLSSQQSTSTISLLPTFLDQEMHTDRDRHSFVESVSMGLGTVNSTGVVKNTGSIHLPSSSSTSSSSSSSPVHHRNNSKITTAISSAIGTGTVGGGSGGESVTFVTPFFSRPDANHQDEGMNGTSGTSASTTTAAKRNSSAMSPDAQQRRSGGGGGGEGGTSSVFSTPKLIKTASSSSAKNIQNNNKGDVSSPFRTPAPLSSAVHNNNNNNVIDRRLSSDSNNGGEITIEKDENDKTSSTTPPTAPGGLVQHHHVSLQQFRGSLTPNIGMTLPKDYDQIATSPMKLKRRRTESVEEKRQ